MGVLVIFSTLLGFLFVPFGLGKKLFGRKGGKDGSQSSSDSTAL
jgi:hypothetical protein